MRNTEQIDLRSDTVTLPTDEMLEAIKYARLGDDVFMEDPTVKQLEEFAAEKMGKEAALLVCSGTQANLTSLMSNCKRGEQVFLESESHIYWYEVGGVSTIAGLLPWPIKTDRGVIDAEELEAVIKPENIHFPVPSLICVENTHNRHGGVILPPSNLESIHSVAKEHSLKLYMDGARIFNAAVGLGIDVKEFAQHVDSMMFCLSKGLSCPVGSILLGDEKFINKARKIRKVLGGGMRQAGIIAAPGIIALEKMIDRLREDHKNARFIAERIYRFRGIKLDLENVQTNIVIFDLDLPGISDESFLEMLKQEGVLALAESKNRIRLVTHYGINRKDSEAAVASVESVMEKLIK